MGARDGGSLLGCDGGSAVVGVALRAASRSLTAESLVGDRRPAPTR
jgi:hypothetical protein